MSVGDAAARPAMIWAQARGGIIGSEGGMPWRLPEDMARFVELTMGSAVVMGRRTWESFPERFRPLRGRRNIVITRGDGQGMPGAEVAHSLGAALAIAGDGPVWVIGGGEVYRQAMALAGRLEVTEIDAELDGDTHAPEILAEDWRAAAGEWMLSSSGLRYRYVSYTR